MSTVPAKRPAVQWSEGLIAAALVRQVFDRDLVCPNCYYAGHEADLLIVHKASLRLIDVEIKVSRADLKSDPDKQKWWQEALRWPYGTPRPAPVRRDWPPRIWKHYYVIPEEFWKADLAVGLPAASGIVTVTPWYDGGAFSFAHVRRPKPNKDAKPIAPHEAIAIARLVSVRYWQAIDNARIRALKEAYDRNDDKRETVEAEARPIP